MHGGHLNAGDDPAIGVDNWRKTFARAAEDDGGFPLPVLIENTAGGNNAMARRFDRLARLWDAVGEFGVGFCLDTCHAHAGGEDLAGIVDRVLAITGRIDLVHANDSRDAFDSGADRHANFGTGQIDAAVIADVCRAAGSDVIVETPGGRRPGRRHRLPALVDLTPSGRRLRRAGRGQLEQHVRDRCRGVAVRRAVEDPAAGVVRAVDCARRPATGTTSRARPAPPARAAGRRGSAAPASASRS